jgi:hypothetical protein
MPLSTSAAITLNADQTSAQDLSTVDAPVNIARQYFLTSGTGVGQADKIWHDTRTLTASSTENLDLAGTGLLDPITQAVLTFVRVKGLFVAAAAGNTNDVIVGANVANGWAGLIGPTGASGGTITLKPGSAFMAFTTDATAWPVTGGTGDLIKVTNSAGGTSVDYSIVVIGASA